MEDQDSDVSSEVDEETVARERAALREAMGTGPQPVPPTIPIPSRLGVEGGGATWPHGGGGSGDDDGDDDDDAAAARQSGPSTSVKVLQAGLRSILVAWHLHEAVKHASDVAK